MQWPVICLGPVCVPLNLLLPFVVGVAHRAGWLSWFKREWVTLRYWRSFVSSTQENNSTPQNGQTQASKAAGSQQEGPLSTHSAAAGEAVAGCTGDQEQPSMKQHSRDTLAGAGEPTPPSGIHRRGQHLQSDNEMPKKLGQQDGSPIQ